MALVVLLVIGATYRGTRLVVADEFPLGPLRRGALRRVDRRVFRWLADLLTCSWCASVWVAAGVTALTWRLRGGGIAVPVLVAAAASAATGFLSEFEGE